MKSFSIATVCVPSCKCASVKNGIESLGPLKLPRARSPSIVTTVTLEFLPGGKFTRYPQSFSCVSLIYLEFRG
jgi:hypothetical protein